MKISNKPEHFEKNQSLSSPSDCPNNGAHLIACVEISPKIKCILFGLAILHFFLLMCYSLPNRLLRTDPYRDVFAYYLVMERIQDGEPMYWPLPETGPHKPSTPLYLYPPVFSSILSLIPSISFIRFAQIWTLLLYGAFWIYSVCLARLALGRITLSGTLLTGLILTLFPGTHTALSLGQVDPILWAFFGLALAFPTLRGVGLMAIAWVKPWALLPIIWAFQKEKSIWIGVFIIAIGGIGIGVIALGVTSFYMNCYIWIRDILPSLGQGTWTAGINGSWSLSFAILRLINALGLWTYEGGILPYWAKTWLTFSGLVFPLITGWILRHRSMTLQISAIGCAAVMFAPTCWTTYLPIFLSPIAVIVGQEKWQFQKQF